VAICTWVKQLSAKRARLNIVRERLVRKEEVEEEEVDRVFRISTHVNTITTDNLEFGTLTYAKSRVRYGPA